MNKWSNLSLPQRPHLEDGNSSITTGTLKHVQLCLRSPLKWQLPPSADCWVELTLEAPRLLLRLILLRTQGSVSLPNSSFRTRPYPEEDFSGPICCDPETSQAAPVVLEAVDTSAQKPLPKRHGWRDVDPGPASALARQGVSAGSGRASGRHSGGRAGGDATHLSALASLLSRISDAKNSSKQKTRNPCSVTSETSHCKLWTSLNAERRKERSGGEGSKKPLQVPLGLMFTWWG